MVQKSNKLKLKIMKLTSVGSRYYLINGKQKKMIPFKYSEVLDNLKISDFDFKKVRLKKEERFKLEFNLLISIIKVNEPLVYELIEGKTIKEASKVAVKIGDDRYEIKIGKYWVKCSVDLYKCSDQSKRSRFSNY